MLRYIKHHLDNIIGVEIYPIVSLLIFFLVFITMLFIVFKLPKNKIDEFSNFPLDNDIKNNTHE